MATVQAWEVSDALWAKAQPLLAQRDPRAADLRRGRLCAAHGMPVEGAAREFWQRQRDPCALSALAERRILPATVAGRFGRIRRDGRHRLGLAEYRRHHG